MNQCETHEQSARSVSERIRFVLVGAAVALIVAVCSQLLFAEDAYAANSVQPKGTLQFQVSGTNDQTEARKILALVNDARSKAKDPASPLAWDYELEKAALQRAAELSIYYNQSHLRPDGSSCITAFPSSYSRAGENIMAATGSFSASAANDGWTKSTGHYENMVNKDFTCMAAATFVAGGSTYWVELFRSPYQQMGETAAVQGAHTYTITAAAENLDLSVTIPSSLTIGTNAQCSVKNTNKGFTYSTVTIVPTSFSWVSSDENIVSVSNSGAVTPKAAGAASVMVKFNNDSAYTSQVTVSQKGTSSTNNGSSTTNNGNSSANNNSSSTKVKEGWKKSGNRWWYQYSDGSYAKGLTTIGSAKYYFDKSGWMKTGWQHATGNSDWYYFNSNGSMKTGWLKSGGKWYYLNAAGVMLDDGFVGIGGKYYHFASNGVMSTGWKKSGGAWYYFASSGAAKQNQWLKSGGKWYYFASDYRMCTGWFAVGKNTYYANTSGVMQTGWKKIGSDWRYFSSSGALQVNKWIQGKYWVNESGIMAKNAWVDGGRYYVNGSGVWVKGAKK